MKEKETESEIRIPVAEPLLDERELKYLRECIETNWISSLGDFVSRFENEFSQYCQAKYGIATNSGTTALHLALAALRVGKKDEVIIPSFTMIATAFAVTYTGAKPVLVDSEMKTWNLDLEDLRRKISDKTRAIVVVHTYGHPVDMDPILELGGREGIPIVEDAAEAHGAEYKGRRAGGIGKVGCFSLYGNKIITTGDGGIVVTNDPDLAEKARSLRHYACVGDDHFLHGEIAFNYKMSNLQAAVGVAQMEKIDDLVEKRRRNASLYNELLESVDGLTLPPEADWAKNVYWMYSVLVEDDFGVSRDRMIVELGKLGIETRAFFIPMHHQPCYKELQGGSFPVADELARKGINLPSGSKLTEEQVRYVVESIKSLR